MENEMSRFLIFLGITLLVAGVISPYLGKIGLGRLPGDFLISRGNLTLYFPLMSCLIVSIVISLIFWIIGRYQ